MLCYVPTNRSISAEQNIQDTQHLIKKQIIKYCPKSNYINVNNILRVDIQPQTEQINYNYINFLNMINSL